MKVAFLSVIFSFLAFTAVNGKLEDVLVSLHEKHNYIFSCLLYLPIIASYEGLVRNFRVHSIEGGQITFAWESTYTSSLRYFYIYYKYAYPGNSPFGASSSLGSISFSYTSRVNSYTFIYTTSVTRFGSAGQYIMWLYVYRSSTPTSLYSEQIYVEVGRFFKYLKLHLVYRLRLFNNFKCP